MLTVMQSTFRIRTCTTYRCSTPDVRTVSCIQEQLYNCFYRLAALSHTDCIIAVRADSNSQESLATAWLAQSSIPPCQLRRCRRKLSDWLTAAIPTKHGGHIRPTLHRVRSCSSLPIRPPCLALL